jgi:hypothetical protein
MLQIYKELWTPPPNILCTSNLLIHTLWVKDLAAKKWLTNDDVEFVRCVLVRADRENDGLSSKEAVDMIQELQPDLTREGT